MEIKPRTPRRAIIMAPSKALPKPLTSKLGTRVAASIIISALITKANKPKVNADSGAVKNHNAGRRDALIRPNTVAAIRKAKMFFDFMPGTINVAIPSPMAVADQAINRAVIILPITWSVNVKRDFVFYQQRIHR